MRKRENYNMENLTINTTNNIDLENMTDEQLKAVIEKALEISDKRNNNTNTSNELNKLYWSMNTHFCDELDQLLDKLYYSKVGIYFDTINETLKGVCSSEYEYNQLKVKIDNEVVNINNVASKLVQELFKVGVVKGVKLIAECYNYKI